MSTITSILLVVALVLSIIVPFGAFLIGEKNRGRYKTSLAVNCFFFFGTLILANIIAFTSDSTSLAAGEAAASAGDLSTGLGYLAAALVTGLSCIGGGIAVASAASAALGAISEDLLSIVSHFQMQGTVREIKPLGSGLINDTYPA